MDKLTELINAGPDRRYTMKAALLNRYDDIVAARALMRTWNDIADALGFTGRGKEMSGCFARVDAAVKKGTLKVPRRIRQAEKRQDDRVVQREPVVRRPLPGQIPVGDGNAMAEALAEKGIVFK